MRKTPNNGCSEELGLLNIQKRALQFWIHLKTSDPSTYHYKALKHQEAQEESPPSAGAETDRDQPDSGLKYTLNHSAHTDHQHRETQVHTPLDKHHHNPTQIRVLFNTKLSVHHGKLPEHSD